MKILKSLTLASLALFTLSCNNVSQFDGPKYLDKNADIEERVEDALSRMTLEEKVAILHAQSKFSSPGVSRLGIPELWCTDGPHGIRPEVLWDEWNQAGWTNDSCIAFPALTCLAASWDTDMAALYGKSIGEEARFREKDVLLGPGVNIYRTPLNGRNFEYMGEDPYLASTMVVPYVRNVQSNGVATCVKHFALNNEETYRNQLDVVVSDRALYEIYLPAFKAAVTKGGSWSIMASYNHYKGRHVAQDTILTKRILKDEWGFDGAVISDWGAVHDTEQVIESGMDLEFGSWSDEMLLGKKKPYDCYYLADGYLERLRDGRADMSTLDERCRRVLRLMFRTSMKSDKPLGSLCSDEHYAAARKIAGSGIVLLKNDGALLPIGDDVKKIAVIGENAVKKLTVGGGSSSLKVQREISPLNGIIERAGQAVEVKWARGYVGSVSTVQDNINTGQDLSDGRTPAELIAEAVQLAKESDIVIFIGGLNKDPFQDSEGSDRKNMDLPYGQDAVIAALAEANPKLVVSLVSGNAVTMPWVESVPSILQCWYLGSEAGHAIADVLWGDVNPSGKLPFTFPVKLEDSPAHFNGKSFPNPEKAVYDEGIYVGYRWFEHKDIKPLFAFGHGLSYTSFEYGDATIAKNEMEPGGKTSITFTVKNVGDRDGAEVVQLYISDSECSVDRPEKELKGFTKIFLKAGEKRNLCLTIDQSSISFFDENAHKWVAEPGEFVACIGSASDDIRTSCRFTLR